MPHECWQSPTVHGYFTIGHRRWSSVWHEIAGWVSGQSLIKETKKLTKNTKSAKILEILNEKLCCVGVREKISGGAHFYTSLLSLFTPSFSIYTSPAISLAIVFSCVGVFFMWHLHQAKNKSNNVCCKSHFNLLFNCCLRNSVGKKPLKLCIKQRLHWMHLAWRLELRHTLAMSEMVVYGYGYGLLWLLVSPTLYLPM